MKTSAVKVIFGILLALVAAYGLFAYFDRGLKGGSRAGGPIERELARVDPDSVRSVRLMRPGDTIHLRPEAGGWRVDGHPADSATVESLRRALREANVGTLASRNPSNHPRLGIGDSARVAEIIGGRGDTARFLVGLAGPVPRSGYVRLAGSDEVYVVHGELTRLLREDEDGWRNQVVARVDTAQISALHVRRGEDRYVLRREGGSWSLAGRAASETAIRPILSRLPRLTASEFAADSVRVAEPDRSLTAVSTEGDTLVHLLLQDAGEETRKHRLTTPEAATVWLVPDYVADRLAPARERVTGDGSSG